MKGLTRQQADKFEVALWAAHHSLICDGCKGRCDLSDKGLCESYLLANDIMEFIEDSVESESE